MIVFAQMCYIDWLKQILCTKLRPFLGVRYIYNNFVNTLLMYKKNTLLIPYTLGNTILILLINATYTCKYQSNE